MEEGKMKKELLGIFIVMLLLLSAGISVARNIDDKIILKLDQDITDHGSSSPIAQPLNIGTVIVKEFIHGAQVKGANGLKIGPDGNIYIASGIGREIVVMNPKNGKVIDRLDQDQGVLGPDDLVFGPDGSLYWTDIVSGEVGRLKPDGSFSKQYVAPMVNPIAFNDEGRLFVAQAFVGDGLYEVDPDLSDLPRKILGVGNLALQFNGFDFGPDGLLYAPRPYSAQIVSVDVDTAEVNVVASGVTGGPRAVAFDSNGELYIAIVDSIIYCDINTGICTHVVDIEEALDNLAFDDADCLYVSNTHHGTIYKVKGNEKIKIVSPGGLVAPQGITTLYVDGKEILFIADWWTFKGFDINSGKQVMPGVPNISPMTVSSDGENLILSSWYTNYVAVWNPETQTTLESYSFNVPSNAIGFQEDLVVAEVGTGSVIMKDHTTGDLTTLASGIYVPSGMACTDDDLWVIDYILGNLYQIIDDGVIQNPKKVVASGLSQPEGMAVDHDGSLLVVESGLKQLIRIDPETGEKTVIADNLAIGVPPPTGWMPFWLLNDVTVDEHGNIYVTADVENLVYRIQVVPPTQSFPILNWLFERFPNLFPILRQVIGFS
jgi:sugar lactone lactonase YvrE